MDCDAPKPQPGHRDTRGLSRIAGGRLASAIADLRVVMAAGLTTGLFLALAMADTASAQTASFPKASAPKLAPPSKIDKTKPLNLNSDELVYDNAGSRVVARGNVELYYNDYSLTADEVAYDQSAKTIIATGNVTIRDPNGSIWRGGAIQLTDDFSEGFIESLSLVGTDDTRITARRAVRKEGNVTEFTNGKYTPCKADTNMPPLWCISAARIVHDQKSATITYQDATFDFLGVPLAFFPYFEHPDPTVKRKSGFLLPDFGSSSTLGYTASTPYYFALSPQYDFLFSPEYLSKQGVLWQGHWRQRLANGQYEIKAAAIDQDADDLPAGVRTPDLEGWRGSLETKGQFSLASWWKFGWDVTLESDDSFRRFYKLDNILLTDRINQVYVEGLSGRNFFSAKLYQFGGLLLSDTPQSESRVHPAIDHEYIVADPVLGGELSFRNNVLSLTRDDAVRNRLNESYSHVRSEAKWRRRLTDQLGITYTPFGEVRGDLFYIDNVLDPVTGQIISDESVTRGLATGGATVSWPWVANSLKGSHVIEPIGQIYVSQAQVEQRQLPNEDARSLIFDDSNLFEPVKFSGNDRVETGTRANVGVQYTFQANDGWYARLLAGQHFHLSGDNAYQNPGRINEVVNGVSTNRFEFSPASGLETQRSDYVVGAYLAPNETFRFLSQSRFDEETLELLREDLYASASYGPISATAIYTFAAADPLLGIDKSQQDITGVASLKLTDRWSLIGTMRYDLDASTILTDSLSLRYADDCFVLTTTYQETFLENVAQGIETDRSLMVRFELKNLGSFGHKTSVLDSLSADRSTR